MGGDEEERQPLPLGARALAAAIAIGDRDAVEKILDSGVGLGVLDGEGDGDAIGGGCLHLLADHPEAAMALLPLLLAKGARHDLRDGAGDTPLHRFVRGNVQQAVAALLAQGAAADARNSLTGDAPLHVAAREGNEDMMALLIALGAANDTLENKEGIRPRDLHALPDGM